ncbi:ABC transporter permease [Mangrovibacillus cuniculi]|uniref:Iron export ABC transporter permease subunit FetB n=1 Tax=Mangrovibacillus cuniculi TaxID=2593652 RepID=A0A7S8CD70_9BACI|nr:iron export ABC transporter permease subunit FetB [Mangrovibacillus cuniculi]QPC47835.1 iron export ABC transporter permease subunit FetB [Mangrovibacillus cuniculi]
MNDMMNLSFWQIASAYIFVLILIAIIRFRKIPREKEVLIATARMTLQLIIVGYILVFIFDNASPWYTLLAVFVMLLFAIVNVYQRTKVTIGKDIKKIVAFAMTVGIICTIAFFMFVVLQLEPWYNPQYFIPIAGMIIGKSMTAVTLGVNHLAIEMKSKKPQIEGALMLGATPKVAAAEVVNQAFDAAMLPTINSLVGMGIVFLPGMMTGQIIAGASPLVALGYQIATMLGVVGSVALCVIIFLQLGYKTYFNDRQQLVDLED